MISSSYEVGDIIIINDVTHRERYGYGVVLNKPDFGLINIHFTNCGIMPCISDILLLRSTVYTNSMRPHLETDEP